MSLSAGQRSGDILFRSLGTDGSSFAGDEFLMGESRASSDGIRLQDGLLSLDQIDSIDDFDPEVPRLRYTWATRFLGIFRKQGRRNPQILPQQKGIPRWPCRISSRRFRASKYLFYAFVGYIMILGVTQFFQDVLGALENQFPEDMDWILNHWGLAGEPSEGFGRWPTDATADVQPVNCHSHNDYWRSVPLYAAVYAGCTGAEADVFLIDEELYVGHREAALTENRTLENLYINPLLDIIERQNPPLEYHSNEGHPVQSLEGDSLDGVFDVDPTQTFVLLIDFKSSGPETLAQLNSQLIPLREKGYLTYFDGSGVVERPITIVATGNAPFELLVTNNTYRDVFFDAPLTELADLSSKWPNPNRAQDPSRGHDHTQAASHVENESPEITAVTLPSPLPDHGSVKKAELANTESYGPSNSYYASTSFTQSIGRIRGTRLTQAQLQLIRGQIKGAHARGLKVRYWGLPQWPIGLRNHVWHILMREGVDMLNVDDLRHATKRDWRKRKGWDY